MKVQGVLTMAQEAGPTGASLVEAALFFAAAFVVVASAWAIVFSGNIVRMAVYLLLTLAGVAGFYFLMRAEFLAAIQLIVYAGGTLILIVFGVMLTSRQPHLQMTIPRAERALSVALAAAVVLTLGLAWWTSPPLAAETPPPAQYSVALIGRALLTKYLVPFEVAGVLLLVVMIGAAFMARKRPT